MKIRLLNKIKYGLDVDGKEYVINWIFTYGIMMITSFLLCLLTADNADIVWEKVIDAFVPTTITFCGMIIIQKVKMLDNNFTALFLLLMIIALAAGYIAYFSVKDNDNQQFILRFFLIILVALSLICSRNVFRIKEPSKTVPKALLNKKMELSDSNFSRK